jgi:pyrroline-5-carboxylate reductase
MATAPFMLLETGHFPFPAKQNVVAPTGFTIQAFLAIQDSFLEGHQLQCILAKAFHYWSRLDPH